LHYKKRRATNIDKFTLRDAKELVIKIKQLENLSEQTIKSYKRIFIDLAKFFTFDVDVKQITQQDVRAYINWNLHEKILYENSSRVKNEKGVSVSTLNNYLIVCRAIFNVLLDEQLVTENVFKKIPYLKEDEEVIETLTIDEINKLFNSFDKRSYVQFRNYVACHVMLDCFSRITETLNLRVDDIDFDKNSVTFKRTKGRKIRSVPLSLKTKRLLKELIKENEVFDSDYLFVTIHGNKLNDSTLRKNLKDVAEKSGITKRIHSHIFRHTASKFFLENRGSIRVLQLLLGHASITTTERYAHVLNVTINEQHQEFSVVNKLTRVSKTRTNRKRK